MSVEVDIASSASHRTLAVDYFNDLESQSGEKYSVEEQLEFLDFVGKNAIFYEIANEIEEKSFRQIEDNFYISRN